MTEPVKHLRRILAKRAECDDEDSRDFAEDLAHVTCPACRTAYERRESEWHSELMERLHGKKEE